MLFESVQHFTIFVHCAFLWNKSCSLACLGLFRTDKYTKTCICLWAPETWCISKFNIYWLVSRASSGSERQVRCFISAYITCTSALQLQTITIILYLRLFIEMLPYRSTHSPRHGTIQFANYWKIEFWISELSSLLLLVLAGIFQW